MPAPKRQRLETVHSTALANSDELGKLMYNDLCLSNQLSLDRFLELRQGPGDLSLNPSIRHPAKHLVTHLSKFGAPVVLQTSPWTLQQKDAAIQRGPHKSAIEHQQFLREDMADMIKKAFWTILPYDKVRHIPNLRISPLGVVPQHERRPRPIVDYTFSGLNNETLRLSPSEAMQFGRALDRLIAQVVHADPASGPVKFIKVDMSDGFYRIWLRTKDIPKLGVAFPNLPSEPLLVALPLALPMGWTESPPYFCAVTETVADLANARLLKHRKAPSHPLDTLASSITLTEPKSAPSVHVQLPSVHSTARPSAVPSPPQRDPLLPSRRRQLAVIDVFVDDFIGAAQGNPARLSMIRRTLLKAIDDVFRPLHPSDSQFRTEPVSLKKLRQGDATWSTTKKVLGWIIDSMSMTIHLSERRLHRLTEILSSLPPTQKRLSVTKWHQLLGELRSMSLALPGTRGLFSPLQVAHQTKQHNRLRLSSEFHAALQDFRWIQKTLTQRPTRLYKLVPTTPTLHGAHDASGAGAGGAWFPSSSAVPRQQDVYKLASPDASLTPTYPTSRNPIVWRMPFVGQISTLLVSSSNLHVTVTNSDLELAGSFLQNVAVSHCFDVRERTIKSDTDNLATLYWNRKGSTTTTKPPAQLLRMLAMHQRHHRYVSVKDYIPGPSNKIADDASRLNHLSDAQFLNHFNSTYPQKASWLLYRPPPSVCSAVTSALRKRRCEPESYLLAPAPLTLTGASGPLSVKPTTWILPFKSSPIPSRSSKCLPTAIALASSPLKASEFAIAPWKVPYATLYKRMRQWGPRTRA